LPKVNLKAEGDPTLLKWLRRPLVGCSLAVLILAILSACGLPLERFAPLLPPLLAITLAFITRNVLLSLFIGIWVGALATLEFHGFGGFLLAAIGAAAKSGDTYLVKSLADDSHAGICIFTLAFGGMVGVIQRCGGIHGIVEAIQSRCRNAATTQVFTWLMGVLVFFDDYANTAVVGNMMRPLSDRQRVSREKLSFIVDATAAPVASLALVSTWIGYEVTLIQDTLTAAHLPGNGYLVFLDSLPYRFYAIWILVFILLSAWMRRDFGPMLAAERRSFSTGESLRPGSVPLASHDPDTEKVEGIPHRWINAAVPIALLVATVLVGLYITGRQGLTADQEPSLRNILSNANSIHALLWASMAGSAAAMLLPFAQKLLTMEEIFRAWLGGCRSMIVAMVVLTLAWGLNAVIQDLGTADLLVEMLGSNLNPQWLPAIIFSLAAIISFSTGTSWGTMAILFPLVLPLLASAGVTRHLTEVATPRSIAATVGAILTGAVFGDHCSPISDTTIMSSTFCGVDHIDHVKTQMTYAMVVGLLALGLGYLPTGFGLNPWISTATGIVAMFAVLRSFGENPEEPIRTRASCMPRD
jgi:Na+/H+ antiporter NhaC